MSHSLGGTLPTLPRVARLSIQPANGFRTDLASTRDWPLRSYIELGALPTAVPCARLHAKNILHEWGMGALADTIELLVSEIATNAVRASASTPCLAWSRYAGLPVIRLWLASNHDHVLIQIWDSDHADHYRPTPGQTPRRDAGYCLSKHSVPIGATTRPRGRAARSSGHFARLNGLSQLMARKSRSHGL